MDVPAQNDVFYLFVLRAMRIACQRGTEEANLVLHLLRLQKGLLPSGSRLLPLHSVTKHLLFMLHDFLMPPIKRLSEALTIRRRAVQLMGLIDNCRNRFPLGEGGGESLHMACPQHHCASLQISCRPRDSIPKASKPTGC